MTRVRWWILALLFIATTVNYLDRIVFSVLIPVIRQDLHMNDQVYGYVTGAFQFAYTVGFLGMGKFIDRFGTKIGYAVAATWWSIAAALHATAQSAFGLGLFRALLGLGGAGNFPACIKAVAEWFPATANVISRVLGSGRGTISFAAAIPSNSSGIPATPRKQGTFADAGTKSSAI